MPATQQDTWQLQSSGVWLKLRGSSTVVTGTGGPPARTAIGFNIFTGTSYTSGLNQNTGNRTGPDINGGAFSETAAQVASRLVADFGAFNVTKCFYSSVAPPAPFSGNKEAACTGKQAMVMCNPGLTSILSGSFDTAFLNYCTSVPAGWTIKLSMANEPDVILTNGSPYTAATYVANVNYLYDLVQANQSSFAANIEVWDCFMGYSLVNAATPRFRTSWTNPAKRDGIGWDTYWNTVTTKDVDGTSMLTAITSEMKLLGNIPWAIPETGDLRANQQAVLIQTDSARSAAWEKKWPNIIASGCQFAILWNVNTGPEGDHRILDANFTTPDTLTVATHRKFVLGS